ncbi:MAG: YdbH domain-containing protein [Myxococcota bacterium]
MPIHRSILARLGLLALVATAALACGLVVGYAQRRSLAERWLVAELEARGFAPVALRVVELDFGGLALRDVAIGEAAVPAIAIGALDAAWSPRGLREGWLDRLSVSGLRLNDVGGLAAIVGGDGDGEPSGPLLLPAPEIELRDASLSFETAEGAGSCAFEGRLNAAVGGAITGEFEIALEHPLARANGSVALSGTLEQLAAELSLALRDAREPARVAPATLSGRVSGAPATLAFELALDGAGGALHVEARGLADVPARSGQAEIDVAPISFAPKGMQPSALLPALEPLLAKLGIAKVAGSVEARGTFALEAGEPKLRLDVAVRELGFEAAALKVAGVSGVVALFAPRLRTPKGQLLSVDRVEAGLTLRGGLLDFQLLPDGVIELDSAAFRWAGGELAAANLKLDASAESTPATLEARGLDLAELLALAPLEGIEGTGRIDGSLPLVRSGEEIRVSGGLLRARPEGGTLRYRPSESASALAASRPNDLGIAVAAFSNFRYDTLEARVDGDLRGELRIALRVRGASPDFQGGQPIELNLALESRLADLVREGVAVYGVPEVVQERLRAFSEKGKK